MTKRLQKVGNSLALVITREMREYASISGDTVDVDFVDGMIVIRRTAQVESEADRQKRAEKLMLYAAETRAKYGAALDKLAK